MDIAFKHQPKETGEVFCVKEEQYTAVEFLAFLEKNSGTLSKRA